MWTPDPGAVATIVGGGTAILGAATLAPLVTAGGRRGLMAHLAMAQHLDYEQLAAKFTSVTVPTASDLGERRRQMENFVDAVVLAGLLNQQRERVRVGLERGKYAMGLLLVIAAGTIACATLDPATTREAVALLGAAWAGIALWFGREVWPVGQLIWEHGWPSAEASVTPTPPQQAITAAPQSSVVPQAQAAKQPAGSTST